MIGVSWNCRGLGNQLTVQELTRISNIKKPDFIFLMETKCSGSSLDSLLGTLGFDHLYVFDCDSSYGGKRGGLCLMWKDSLNLHIMSASLHHIDAEIRNRNDIPIWRLTGLYGWAEDNDKHLTWELLRELNSVSSLAWLCLGDFNEILASTEKIGGTCRGLHKMAAFQDAIENCNLHDLGFSGYQFTWSNGQSEETNIQERLDRVLANDLWTRAFPSHDVEHLVRVQSDHCPLLLRWNKSRRSNRRRGKKRFRFEAMWLHEDTCSDVVETAWNGHRPAVNPMDFCNKTNSIGGSLQDWEKDKFGNVNHQIDMLLNALERAQSVPATNENLHWCKSVENELKDLMSKKETMWRQRSRAIWLAEGDKNTSFFHKTATGRKSRNHIARVKQDNDEWVEDAPSIERIFLHYFQHIFKSESSFFMDEVLGALHPRISSEMNYQLCESFTEEEVTIALNQMHPLKAPGPDGLPVLFFTKFWPTVKSDTLSTVLNILNNDYSPAALNHTHIILIPKKKNSDRPQDFRPIILCNVVMKLVTKCIANRLKPLLPNLISPTQSAFIPGPYYGQCVDCF